MPSSLPACVPIFLISQFSVSRYPGYPRYVPIEVPHQAASSASSASQASTEGVDGPTTEFKQLINQAHFQLAGMQTCRGIVLALARPPDY